jgi:cyanate permease
MLLVGYVLSSIAPVVLGLVRDATSDFDLVLWILVGLALAMIPLALALGPGRLRRAEAV